MDMAHAIERRSFNLVFWANRSVSNLGSMLSKLDSLLVNNICST
jgi:hypothetical protein